jgi:hypothetical protein
MIPVPLVARRLFDLAVDRIALYDRRRRIRDCSAYGRKVPYSSARRARGASYFKAEEVWTRDVAGPQSCPSGEWTFDRFPSTPALIEAFAVQLSELRALPTIEPSRRLAS